MKESYASFAFWLDKELDQLIWERASQKRELNTYFIVFSFICYFSLLFRHISWVQNVHVNWKMIWDIIYNDSLNNTFSKAISKNII